MKFLVKKQQIDCIERDKLADGQIAESGTHEELLAKGGKYAAMWNAEQKISA